MNNDYNLVQQGWQCPICKRVYSPSTMMCCYCGGDTVVSTDGSGTGDWQKHQSVTTATAEDKRTCDNCKHIEGLPIY